MKFGGGYRYRGHKVGRLVLAVAAAAGIAAPGGAYAAPAAALTVAPNGTVSLQGTPHLWIADANGALHLAGDTRALADKTVDWGTRVTATLADIRSTPLGAPYLSAALVKVGDAIYTPNWETGEAAPTLLHIQSIQDLQLFGVDAANYGSTVLSQADWEQRYGFKVADLQKGELTPIDATAAPAPSATPPASGTSGTSGTTPGTGTSTAGTLNHVPVFGTDVSFTLPGGRNWESNVGTIEAVPKAMPKLIIPGEQVIAYHRVLDDERGPYVYLVTSVLPLDQHPEIKTAADYASAASNQGLAFFVSGSSSTTVAGQPAQGQEFKLTAKYDPRVQKYGIIFDGILGDAEETIDQTDWFGRSVFVIKGNYGYQFRLLSVEPAARNSRVGDQNTILSTVTFGY
jgi:hypothetical protein